MATGKMIVIDECNRQDIADSIPEIWDLLSMEQKDILTGSANIRRFSKNELIYKEDVSPEFLFSLISGTVKVFKSGALGKTQIVRLVSPAGLFGFRAAFAGENYMTSASALEESTLCAIPVKVMKDIIRQNINVAIVFIKQLAYMLGDADLLTVNLTQKHIRARMADSLIKVKEKYGVEDDGNTLCINTSREDLANTSGMTTNNAIRTLSAFATEGIIKLNGKKIKILDEEKLQEIASRG